MISLETWTTQEASLAWETQAPVNIRELGDALRLLSTQGRCHHSGLGTAQSVVGTAISRTRLSLGETCAAEFTGQQPHGQAPGVQDPHSGSSAVRVRPTEAPSLPLRTAE